MRWWPWRRERRAASTTDAVLQALAAGTYGAGGLAAATAAVESCIGLWGRAFSCASVLPATPATRALTAPVLREIGRGLAAAGESLHLLEVAGGRLRLVQAASFEVLGAGDETNWRYRVELAAPSNSTTRVVGSESVLHCRYATRPGAPWRGLSPMHLSPATAALGRAIEESLGREFRTPQGIVVFAGADQSDADWLDAGDGPPPAENRLAAQIGNLRGGVLVANADRQTGSGAGAANTAPVTERIGPTPPREIHELRGELNATIWAAHGVPPALMTSRSAAAAREGWRQLLHGTIAPVAALVAAEASAKLEADVRLSFEGLFASDLSGRARAYGSLVKAGMAPDRAEALAGLAA